MKKELVRDVENRVIKGAKAGVIPGTLVGILSYSINYYLLAVKHNQELSIALGETYFPSTQGLITNSLLTVVMLTFCGVLYALLFERLPSEKHFWKAFPFGLLIFIISRIGDFFVDYPLSSGLFIDNALFSAPLLLVAYPYLLSKLYTKNISKFQGSEKLVKQEVGNGTVRIQN